MFEKELTEQGTQEKIELWKDVKSKLERVHGAGEVDIEHMLTSFSFPYIDPSALPPNVICHYGIDTPNLIPAFELQTAKSIVEDCKEFIYKRCDIEKQENIFPVYSKLWNILSGSMGFTSNEFYMRHDLEIFTTNYDRCFEIFYNIARRKIQIPSQREITLDIGVSEDDYNFDYYQSEKPRLYKLHGSIRRYVTRANKIRLYDGLRKEGDSIDGDEVVKEWMIWPLAGKSIYQHPYSRLMEWFQESLLKRKVWLFVGFSFRDEGINLMLKNVNDRLEDRRNRWQAIEKKKLVLIDRFADKKKDLFKDLNMIHFFPIVGEFGKEETFEKLRVDAQNHALFG